MSETEKDLGLCGAGMLMFAREPDGVWPLPGQPCNEPAVMVFHMITPGLGLYEVRVPLCAMHEAEMRSHFHVVGEPFVPEGRTYYVYAKKVLGDLWELTVPEVGVTQWDGYLSDAWPMVADYILTLTGEVVAQNNIRLVMEGDPDDILKRPETDS